VFDLSQKKVIGVVWALRKPRELVLIGWAKIGVGMRQDGFCTNGEKDGRVRSLMARHEGRTRAWRGGREGWAGCLWCSEPG